MDTSEILHNNKDTTLKSGVASHSSVSKKSYLCSPRM
ncbi:hypothetical protein CPC197_1306, partial [Chlamydia psittaci C1/97]